MSKTKSTPAKSFRKLASLYTRMADAYTQHAKLIGLDCTNCTDNCCYSYFQHHTYIEWAYMWKGLEALPTQRKNTFIQRAEHYVARARRELAQGIRPHIMCPLNEDGLCGLYEHRFMICRLHGVPNILVHPNGKSIRFPGCWQSQELTKNISNPPELNRSSLYMDLVKLEMEFVGSKLRTLPKVDLTLAEMIVFGLPQLSLGEH